MRVDKNYCVNSFLQFRTIVNKNILFKSNMNHYFVEPLQKVGIKNFKELDVFLCEYIKKNCDSKTALMLSGGMDSAILASYLPAGSKVFSLKCHASEPTTDETNEAKKIAENFDLDFEIIDISWEDYLNFSNKLMLNKGAPIHSIEVQIYKAALIAKKQGFTKLLFGESADSIYGGLSKLLSVDWNYKDFIKRYNFVPTEKVLKKPELIEEPYIQYKNKEKIDVYRFLSTFFFQESVNSYYNACFTAGVELLSPFSETFLDTKLDLARIREGESKYIIRDLFKVKFPGEEPNPKIPMPRATDLWLKDWKGPLRSEFKKDCLEGLSGDQKYYIYILEKFLNTFEISE